MSTILLKNCGVYTMDGNLPCADQILIVDGRVNALGNSQNPVLSTVETTEVDEEWDLQGKTVLPGFNDSHLHLLSYGIALSSVDISEVNSEQELVGKVADYIEQNQVAPGTWIVARGLDEHLLQERRFPTKEVLDNISLDHPVMVKRKCSHLCAVNTMGLNEADITRDIGGESEGGEIYIDSDGLPTGILAEKAQEIVEQVMAKPSETEIKKYIKLAAKEFASKGLTSVQSDDLTAITSGKDEILKAYIDLAEQGELPIKVNLQLQLISPEQIKDFMSQYGSIIDKTIGGKLTFGPLKILLDGSLGGATAAMRDPYQGTDNDRGIMIYTTEQLHDLVETAVDYGMQVACHAIGDKAIEEFIDIIEHMQAKYGYEERHRIIHCQLTDLELIERIADQNLYVDAQPTFVSSDYEIVPEKIGQNRSLNTYAWKTMLDRGVVVAGGSDCPVEDFAPLDGLRAAITRQDSNGNPLGGWHPWENLSVFEALKMFTVNPAAATFEEESKGKLAPGYQADLVVLSEDPYTVPPSYYNNISIERVMVDGNWV